jgi:hypothetical protein
LLIREPRAAIASWILYSRWNVEYAIEGYIAYYSPLVRYRDEVVVAEFDQVINDYSTVLATLKSRYDLNIKVAEIDDAFKAKVFEGIRSFPWGIDPMRISLPTRERGEALILVQTILREERFQKQLAKAKKIYEYFTENANARGQGS